MSAAIDEAVLAGLRAAFAGPRLLQIPNALDERAAAAVRAGVKPRLQPFALLDRGRYQHARADEAELIDFLRAMGEGLLGASLAVADARWLRLTAGCYSLLRDSRGPTEDSLELTLDASAGEHASASLIYARPDGPVLFQHQPRSLIAFDRRPGAFRYDQYLPLAEGPADVWRLRVALKPA